MWEMNKIVETESIEDQEPVAEPCMVDIEQFMGSIQAHTVNTPALIEIEFAIRTLPQKQADIRDYFQ